EDDETRDAAERETRSRRAVAVDGGERARCQRREQLHEGRRYEDGESAPGHVGRVRREVARYQVAERSREDRDEDRDGQGEQQEGEGVGATLGAEPPLRGRAGGGGNDDHPECLCGENEHEGDAV